MSKTTPIENLQQVSQNKGYIAGLAAFKFKPNDDWSFDEAKEMYELSNSFPSSLNNRILFEDCISGMKRITPKSIDLIIADPPFGIDFDKIEPLYRRDASYVIEDYQEITEDYFEFSKKWISQLPKLMKETSSAYIFSGWNHLESILAAGKKAKLKLVNHIIWTYPFGVFTKRKFVNSHYHILLYVKNDKKYYFNKIEHYPSDSWFFNRDFKPKREKNGTKLPLNLVKRCMDYSSKPGHYVFDPFMGNGTTAIVAKANLRNYIGFEKNKKLKPIIEQNLMKTELGSLYKPYTNNNQIGSLKKKYPRAYKLYMKEKANEKTT
ncbi:MAG: site-specific DNA-methyltransferase [Candidatus Heimdallarchaeota archaeon]|nr:site-specific DNA-methyltransferase [Candidatus Heimdallarchaeota archaeon]MCK4609892.1 site-specific DNA-methyltransferase [Candidatus Heimdallarchaeota archaeon]